jgi:hypothetical protein
MVIKLEIYTFSATVNMEKMVSRMLTVCMCAPLIWLGWIYSYSVFMNLSIMGWCMVNMNIVAPEIWTFE